MPLWTEKATLELVKLLHIGSADTPEYLEELIERFHKSQPYNGVCQTCSTNPFTRARIVRKSKRLITESDKIANQKGKLVLPPSKAEANQNNLGLTQDTAGAQNTKKMSLEEMLNSIAPPPKPKKKPRRKTERRSQTKTLDDVAYSSAVKAGTAVERRQNT